MLTDCSAPDRARRPVGTKARGWTPGGRAAGALALLAALGLAGASGAARAGKDAAATSADADLPLGFGARTNWFAVKSRDPQAVARALGLADAAASAWSIGLPAATERPGSSREASAFITPPINGWVLVVGSSLPYPDHQAGRSPVEAQIDQRFDHLFTALAAKFDEVQFFGSYRTLGFSAWARARNARIERIFSFADGEVLANVGPQSAEERALKFPDLSGLSLEAARDALLAALAVRAQREEQMFADGLDRTAVDAALRDKERGAVPEEDDVLDLAGAWSVNPTALEGRELPAGGGLSARLPPQMRQ